jgi:ribonucleoside-triphosphate reductase
MTNDLWATSFEDADTLEDIFKHGTLSIGFIGLSEMIEVLTGKKYFETNENYQYAKDFVKYMRDYINKLRIKYNRNFSLLATSGEFISGRFPDIDKLEFNHKVLEKDYYTNSFHIDVDSKLSAFEKVKFEGYFHGQSSGGCITYIEMESAPIGNNEAIIEIIDAAEKAGVHYLGFNYPLDVCNECNEQGVFDSCPKCNSENILRIRRVSGYLEILDYFTPGKKAEVKNRKSN